MDTPIVSVENLSKYFRLYHEKNQYLKSTLLHGRRSRYEQFWAVRDVSFDIKSGSTFGIIGSNGSGKSTLLKCLAGILAPDEGSLKINGRLSALLELGAGFHPDLSGRENIYLNGAILGMTNREIEMRFADIAEFAGLERFIDTPVKNYSSGMVVRLGFSIAANVEPEILLIDEVLAVGDASFQQRCYEKIETFREDGRTIILVSHGLLQIVQLCDEVAWMERGKLKAKGSALQIVSDYTGQSYEAHSKNPDEIGSRWGSGEAEIVSISITNQDDEVHDVYQSGKPLHFLLETYAHIPLDDLVIGLRITDLHGNPIWGSNTRRQGFSVSKLHGLQKFRFTIPRLPLLEGTYELTAALSDSSEVHAYDHWDRRIRFNVHQYHTFDEGIVAIEGFWSNF